MRYIGTGRVDGGEVGFVGRPPRCYGVGDSVPDRLGSLGFRGNARRLPEGVRRYFRVESRRSPWPCFRASPDRVARGSR